MNFLDKLIWKHLLTTQAKEKDTSVHFFMQYVIITISLELWFLQDDFVSIIQEIQWMNWKSYTFLVYMHSSFF